MQTKALLHSCSCAALKLQQSALWAPRRGRGAMPHTRF